MMFCTARAMLSVPPPGPAVATNSIGFCGCQAAHAGAPPETTAALTDNKNKDVPRMISSNRFFLFCLISRLDVRSGDAFPALPGCRDDCAFLLERFDLLC